MIDVIDRVPTNAGRVRMIPVAGQANTYDMVREDNPTVAGTSINRTLLMAMQGFVASTTVFNSDGSITETSDTGTLKTVFNTDGSIVETFTGKNGNSIVKTTIVNGDGSITQTIS